MLSLLWHLFIFYPTLEVKSGHKKLCMCWLGACMIVNILIISRRIRYVWDHFLRKSKPYLIQFSEWSHCKEIYWVRQSESQLLTLFLLYNNTLVVVSLDLALKGKCYLICYLSVCELMCKTSMKIKLGIRNFLIWLRYAHLFLPGFVKWVFCPAS